MADLAFLALLVVLFAALVAFVHACDRIVDAPSGTAAADGPARADSVDDDGGGDGGTRVDVGVGTGTSREGEAP